MHPLVPRLSLLVAATAIASSLVNSNVPEPYLDEVFHIPQAQLYCRNIFSVWDPKLTTPPGLYLLSYPISFLTTCTPAVLRAINAVGVALILPVIVYRILLLLHPNEPSIRPAAAHTAINIALFPLLFFFAGLYYTDVYSTIFVLASYMFWLQGRTWCSAAASWGGLWFRQTNVLWTAFLMVLEGVRALEAAQGPEEEEEAEVVKVEVVPAVVTPAASTAKKRKKKGRAVGAVVEVVKKEPEEEVQDGPWTIDVKDGGKMNNGELGKAWEKVVSMARKIRVWNPVFSDDVTSQDFLFSTPTSLAITLLRYPTPFLVSTAPYTLVLLSFVSFIIYNNFTIVLGDATAHQPTLHIPQLYYFTLFTTITSAPLLLSPSFLARFYNATIAIPLPLHRLRRRRRSSPRKPPANFLNPTITPKRQPSPWVLLRTLLITVLIAATVWRYTVLHPYLLADNRHFVFYIFRRSILAHWSIRYAAVPVYVASIWSVYEGLRRAGLVSVVWVWCWSVAVAGTLVTAGLVEGRYFILGWVLWRCHVGTGVGWRRWAETAGFAAMDMGVLWVFLRWGFEWESEKGKVQRFMW